MATIFQAKDKRSSPEASDDAILANQQNQHHEINPVIPSNSPEPEPSITTKPLTSPSLPPPATTPIILTLHPQGPHGVNNIHYDPSNAATPEHPVGAAKGESNKPSPGYYYPESQKWYTIAIVSLVFVLLFVFVVWRKVTRRREIKRQLREEGEIREIRWD
jgi:hypothetical protein